MHTNSTARAESIKSWCARRGISQATFYRHRDEMPVCIKIAGQYRILPEDDERWERQQRAKAERRTAA